MNHRHVLSVWNPVYGPRVMEMHLEVLLDQVRNERSGAATEDDVYVWWGKVRSPHRQTPLPHIGEILAIDVELERDDPGRETHLYLTDYRSLYVAHLGEVTESDVRASDPDHVPRYYTEHALRCDCWFKLWDMRRLYADDTVAVVRELAKLRNQRYHDQPVSLYGGMVDLPLIVAESLPVRYFDEQWRSHTIGPAYWVEFDNAHSGLGAMERELRQNLFGDKAWSMLQPTARVFIATAEKIFRDHASDEGFDYGACLVEMTKALEAQCNWLVRKALQGAPVELRMVNVHGKSVDITQSERLGLGELRHALTSSERMAKHVCGRLDDGKWFVEQLSYILGTLAEVRGRAAHSARIQRDEVDDWRNRLMGIGCQGIIARLACIDLKM